MQNMMSVVYAQVVHQVMMPTVIKTVQENVLVMLIMIVTMNVQVQLL